MGRVVVGDQRFVGARLFSDLFYRQTLKLLVNGGQSGGDMLSFVLKAAAFCTNGKRGIEAWLTPAWRALQQSGRDERKTWIILLKSLKDIKEDLPLDKWRKLD